nr:hypothetical protein [Tanacetum cinerariifolium]
FADTHNVVAILEKSDADEEFEQIMDFLSRNYIHNALTVSPHIYISCIKQFWNSVLAKRSGDVTRLQTLVDKKTIVIFEDVIREILQLNDVEGMFLIHTILQSLSGKRTSWNEFSTVMDSTVICLSKGQRFNISKYIFDSLVRNVDSSSKFYMYPRFIQLIIQAQVGDLSSHTTRFISYALTQKVFANMRRFGKEHVATDVSQYAVPSSPPHDIPSPSQEPSSPPQQPYVTPPVPTPGEALPKLEIVKLKARVKKLEQSTKVKSSKSKRLRKVRTSRRVESFDDMKDVFNQGRMIANMDMNEGIKSLKVVEVLTTTKLMTEVVTTATSQVSAVNITIHAISTTVPAAKPSIPATYTRRRKGVIGVIIGV